MTKAATETNNSAEVEALKNNEEKPAAEEVKSDGNDVSDKKDGSAPSSPKKQPKAPKPTVHKPEFEKDVVYLYQFSRCPVLPSASPYCLKVETWLRLIGQEAIKYENVDHHMKYKSKKGQLPFVEFNGKEIADSDIILKTLSEHFSKDIDEGLTEDQRNISHAFESMLNNHTAWVVRWWRYNNPKQFLEISKVDIQKTLDSWIPKPVLNFVFRLGFKGNAKQAVGHGLGRHSDSEIIDFGKQDLKALSNQLGKKDYFFGKEPRLLDVNAFAHLCQFIYVPFEGMKEWIETETPNLVAFVDRMKTRCWPDWDDICSTLEMNTHLPKKEQTEEEKKAEKELEEAKAKKEELKKQKEEQKKEKAEKKKAEKEEKERKKKEAKEKAEKEKAEKAEKEKAEKEKAEKEKAEKAAADKAAAEEKAKSEESTKDSDAKADGAAAASGDEPSKTTESKDEKK